MTKDGLKKNALAASVGDIYGVGRAKVEAYARLGVECVGDLLEFYPRAYEYRGDIKLLAEAREGVKCSLVMTVATEPKVALIRRGMSLLKFRAFDESGSCEITYFNQNYLKDKFTVGSVFRFWGRVEVSGRKYMMSSPVAEPYADGVELPSLVPVYRLTDGLSQKQIAQHIEYALGYIGELKDTLPAHLRVKNELCTLNFALRNVHKPESYASLAIAKRRLAYDRLLSFAIAFGLSQGKANELSFAPECKDNDISALTDMLEYELTDAQKRTIDEIKRDMSGRDPMNRIVVGDVGCGKTVCAAAAMLIAMQSGRQAALMAPTEILAKQHYAELSPMFEKMGYSCALLTGSTTAAKKRAIYAALASEDKSKRLDAVIGTQALLSEGVQFAAAGLTVTDEQHRFGVLQRAELAKKSEYTHLLVMSATPIPRSLALVMYGNLDISRIDQMPPGRQRVDTFVVDESYRARLDAFISKQASEGSQVYIVCPAVEESEIEEGELSFSDITMREPQKEEKPPLKAAVKYAEELSARLPHLNIAFVHGKMKPSAKDVIMTDFADGKIDVLVSTTVIEVGINVPNATLMIVENADRFGLSQLHQLRGRVGRGKKKAYCVLVTDCKTSGLGEKARRRLETMRTTYDGYAIAEEDLLLRGPGDFLPFSDDAQIRQSGGIAVAEMCDDAELMRVAFEDASATLEADPTLKGTPELLERIKRAYGFSAGIIN